MAEKEHIIHPFEPVYDERSRVLVLGTMPSPRSRRDGFYYGHPQNRFWGVLAALFDEPVDAYRGIMPHLHPFAPPTLDVPQVVELEGALARNGTSLAEPLLARGRE